MTHIERQMIQAQRSERTVRPVHVKQLRLYGGRYVNQKEKEAGDGWTRTLNTKRKGEARGKLHAKQRGITKKRKIDRISVSDVVQIWPAEEKKQNNIGLFVPKKTKRDVKKLRGSQQKGEKYATKQTGVWLGMEGNSICWYIRISYATFGNLPRCKWAPELTTRWKNNEKHGVLLVAQLKPASTRYMFPQTAPRAGGFGSAKPHEESVYAAGRGAVWEIRGAEDGNGARRHTLARTIHTTFQTLVVERGRKRLKCSARAETRILIANCQYFVFFGFCLLLRNWRF